jgi:uncharacterized membrane protein YgdD (TMEM256/DUF423 family)
VRQINFHSVSVATQKLAIMRLLHDVASDGSTRQKGLKKRSLHAVNEYFLVLFNAVMSSAVIVQGLIMLKQPQSILPIAALSAALAVACGAFGAHALKIRVAPEDLLIWQTAVNYQMWHSLALLLIGVLAKLSAPSSTLIWSARSFLIGIIIFSGSLYLLVLTNTRWLGAITPIGGVAFIAAWLLFAKATWQMNSNQRQISG